MKLIWRISLYLKCSLINDKSSFPAKQKKKFSLQNYSLKDVMQNSYIKIKIRNKTGNYYTRRCRISILPKINKKELDKIYYINKQRILDSPERS
jgi:hypothetical protein